MVLFWDVPPGLVTSRIVSQTPGCEKFVVWLFSGCLSFNIGHLRNRLGR